jgi:glycosyltransferase involved in cell wall biosynthesis
MQAQNLTLITVNWNTRAALELLLKSYVAHHYEGEALPCLVIDNGSTDGSLEWMKENGVPHVSVGENIGHMRGINLALDTAEAETVLITDTDVRFDRNVLKEQEVGQVYADVIPISRLKDWVWLPRIDPSRCTLPWKKLKELGIAEFDDLLPHAPELPDSGSSLLRKLRARAIEPTPFPSGAHHYRLSSLYAEGAYRAEARAETLSKTIPYDTKPYAHVQLAGALR